MRIHELRKKQDMKGVRLDSVVNVGVHNYVEGIGDVTGCVLGFLYERTKEGFTTIQQIAGNGHPDLGRVAYSFSDKYIHQGEMDFPLQPETPAYTRYERKMVRLGAQLTKEKEPKMG